MKCKRCGGEVSLIGYVDFDTSLINGQKRVPKYKNTKPELALQQALTQNNIVFELDKHLYGRPDIFIDTNICIKQKLKLH